MRSNSLSSLYRSYSGKSKKWDEFVSVSVRNADMPRSFSKTGSSTPRQVNNSVFWLSWFVVDFIPLSIQEVPWLYHLGDEVIYRRAVGRIWAFSSRLVALVPNSI
jgi:hypothetical protein